MIVFGTYCSKTKSLKKGKLNPFERYTSNRIKQVKRYSDESDMTCLILSGKYGILFEDDELEYYDKYLNIEEVDELVERIVASNKLVDIDVLVWFSSGVDSYDMCIRNACSRMGIELVWVPIDVYGNII